MRWKRGLYPVEYDQQDREVLADIFTWHGHSNEWGVVVLLGVGAIFATICITGDILQDRQKQADQVAYDKQMCATIRATNPTLLYRDSYISQTCR